MKRFRVGDIIDTPDRGEIRVEEYFEVRLSDGMCVCTFIAMSNEDIESLERQGVFMEKDFSWYDDDLQKEFILFILYAYIDVTQEDLEGLAPSSVKSEWLSGMISRYQENSQVLEKRYLEDLGKKREELFQCMTKGQSYQIPPLFAHEVAVKPVRKAAKKEEVLRLLQTTTANDEKHGKLFKLYVRIDKLAEAFLQVGVQVLGFTKSVSLQEKCDEETLSIYFYFLVIELDLGKENFAHWGKTPFYQFIKDKVFPDIDVVSRSFSTHVGNKRKFFKKNGGKFESNVSKTFKDYQKVSACFKETSYYKQGLAPLIASKPFQI